MADELKLIRNALGVIDLSDIEDKEMTPQDRRAYCASIYAVYPLLEKDIKNFLYNQLLFGAKEAESWEQVLFGRGAFDGLTQALNHWKLAHDEHINSSTKAEFDKHSPLSEI